MTSNSESRFAHDLERLAEAGKAKPNDGGPAFPNEWNGGMSLRDWLAGSAPARKNLNCGEVKALIGNVKYPEANDFAGALAYEAKIDAAWRYLRADAMLAEREKREVKS